MLGSTLVREALLREPGRISHKVATPKWAVRGSQLSAEDIPFEQLQDETLEVSIEDLFADKPIYPTTSEVPSIAVTFDDEEGLDPEAAAELAAAALDAGEVIETELCDLGTVKINVGQEVVSAGAMVEDAVFGNEDDEHTAAETIADFTSITRLIGEREHETPQGHSEDIELRVMEESDSDDQLPELYPLLERYFSEHVEALVPKKSRRSVALGGPRNHYIEERPPVAACWVCGLDHESGTCPNKRCFFCAKLGHESCACPDRKLVCQHCNLRGHTPPYCPTLASQEPTFFGASRCMRCGAMGHLICGVPPLMLSTPPGTPFPAQGSALGPGTWAPRTTSPAVSSAVDSKDSMVSPFSTLSSVPQPGSIPVLGAAAKSSVSRPCTAAEPFGAPTLQAEEADPIHFVEGLACKSAPARPTSAAAEDMLQQEQKQQQQQRPPRSLTEVANSLCSRRKPPEPQKQASGKRPRDAAADEVPPQVKRMMVPMPGKAPVAKRAPAAKALQEHKTVARSMPAPKKVIRVHGIPAPKKAAGVPAPKKKQRQQKVPGLMPKVSSHSPPVVIVCD